MREGQGEVRETGTGNATPPCLLRGDITGIHAERGDREERREKCGAVKGDVCTVKLLDDS